MTSIDPALSQFFLIATVVFLFGATVAGLVATRLSPIKRYIAISYAFISLTGLLALSYHHETGLSYAFAGILGMYALLVSIPLFFKISTRISIQNAFLYFLISAIGASLLMIYAPQLFRTMSKSVFLILAVDVIISIMYLVNYKHRYMNSLLVLLAVVLSFHLEFFFGAKTYHWIGKLPLIILAIVSIIRLAREEHQQNILMMQQLERLEKEFDDEVEKGVRSRTYHIERIKDRMAEVNRIDHLTKALNRKAIMSELDSLVQSKQCQKFVMLIFDIDRFKSINDSLGHAVGDDCLKALSSIAMDNIRDVDFLGRYGGDEFIILLPNQSLKEGLVIAERFRAKVDATNDPHFSISIGASAYPWDGNNFKTLLEAADKGLYVSKENGKNKVSYAGYIKLDQVEDNK